jgi:hypothetical protein
MPLPRGKRALIALASWAPAKADVRLTIDWKALGLNPGKAVLFAPRSAGFQKFQQWKPGDAISIEPQRGWLIIVDETGPTPADSAALNDQLTGRSVLLKEDFTKPLGAAWTVHGKSVGAGNGLTISAPANVTACVDLKLPVGVTAVDCRIDTGSDRGETWGPGLALFWPGGQALRINARIPENGFGIDSTAGEQRHHVGHLSGEGPVTLRIRMDADKVYAEACNPDEDWQTIATIPRKDFPGDPVSVRLGKCKGVEGVDDWPTPGAAGTCSIPLLRVYGQ